MAREGEMARRTVLLGMESVPPGYAPRGWLSAVPTLPQLTFA